MKIACRTRPARRAPLVLLLGPALAAIAGCADQDDPLPPPTITWAECAGVATLECGTLAAPRDHSRPFDETFDIPVVRAPAADPQRRIGSLLLNPGGPGGSGVALATIASITFPPGLRDRFDIVGFDPRGQAGSAPAITCAGDLGPFIALDMTPDSEQERRAIIDQSRALAEGCAEESGELLRRVGTDSIVRDMDLLREALGDDGLTYLGYSYGTFLGAIYAETFPDRVRALVLDAPVDPSGTAEQMIAGQAYGFEDALERFFAWCDADASCAIHDGAQGGAAAAYDAVQAAVEASPLPAPPGGERQLGPGELGYGVAAALYQPGRWGKLAKALALAAEGDGSALLELSDGYVERNEDGSYGNGLDVYYAVTSVDMPSWRDPDRLGELAASVQKDAPRIGAYLPYSAMPSELWPVRPWRGAERVNAEGAPPILVVGGTHDPATPHAWAESLVTQLPGAALLSRDGDGHTSFRRGNDCIDEKVIDYLVDLTLPSSGTVCPD